jgi:hypothetical protein
VGENLVPENGILDPRKKRLHRSIPRRLNPVTSTHKATTLSDFDAFKKYGANPELVTNTRETAMPSKAPVASNSPTFQKLQD